MGYSVSMHLIKRQPGTDAIRAALPSSIGFRVYRHSSLALFAIDTFSGIEPPRYPFTSYTSAADLSIEFAPHLRSLAAAYEDARRAGGANGIKRSYINLAEVLSKVLGQPVLSIYADDDECDFACLAAGGTASVITALCDDSVVRCVNGTTEVAAGDDDPTLHKHAIEAFEAFAGVSAETIGLGTFDPPIDFGFVPVGD